MTTASVSSTSTPTPSNPVDPTNSGSHTDPADAAFGAVLAGAQSADPNRSQPASDPANAAGSTSTHPSAGQSTTNDPTAPAAPGSQASKPPATQTSVADASGLLAALAVLAWTPPQANTTPPAGAPAPAELGSSTAPLVTGPADPTPGSAAVALPETTPAAGSAPTPGPVAGSARPDHTSNLSAVLVGDAPGDSTSGHPPGATSIAPTSPAAVDPARAAPFERPRPQLAFSAPSSDAATTAATAAAPASAPTATANAEDPTAAGATVAVPPAEQLVSVLTPLRSTTNGTYTLRLELKPPELGRVEMRVEMKDGVLSASIHTDHEGSAQLVRDALSDLRDLLNRGGIHTGDLTVSDGGVGPGSRDARDTQSSAPATSTDLSAPSDDATTVGTIRSGVEPNSTSLLDVRL